MAKKKETYKKKTLLQKSGLENIVAELTRSELRKAPRVLYKKTVQDSIPIFAVHEKENLIETYEGFFTRSYWIKENNYQSETEEREEDMYIDYRKVLNSLGTNEEYAVSIMNRNVNMRDIEENVLCKETGDELDYLRLEIISAGSLMILRFPVSSRAGMDWKSLNISRLDFTATTLKRLQRCLISRSTEGSVTGLKRLSQMPSQYP